MAIPAKGFEFFEHTADIGLRAWGPSLETLFIASARGLVELLVEQSQIQGAERRPITLAASSVETLLRLWLKEVLFWFNVDHFLPADYRFTTIDQTTLDGEVIGERFDRSRHVQGTEVKGVTYHQFRISRRNRGWEAEIIFDV